MHLIRCIHPTEGWLPFALPKSLKAIVVCFKVHNKCINDGVPNPNIDYEEDVHDVNVMADLLQILQDIKSAQDIKYSHALFFLSVVR